MITLAFDRFEEQARKISLWLAVLKIILLVLYEGDRVQSFWDQTIRRSPRLEPRVWRPRLQRRWLRWGRLLRKSGRKSCKGPYWVCPFLIRLTFLDWLAEFPCDCLGLLTCTSLVVICFEHFAKYFSSSKKNNHENLLDNLLVKLTWHTIPVSQVLTSCI